MNKLHLPRSILYLFLISSIGIGCVNNDKEFNDNIFKIEPVKSEPSYVFNLIDCLNESNKKARYLAGITFIHNKDAKTQRLLLKIKNDHRKIDFELKNLAEKNLIIIPKLINQSNINPDSLKGKNSDLHLLKTLDSEIENQIIIFDQIEKASKNSDFKTFSKKSKLRLQTNKTELEKTIQAFKNG
jgi:hypothetical protein